MLLRLRTLFKFLFEFLPLMEVKISVAFIHRVLRCALLCHSVVIYDIVVWLLQNLPRLWNGLHQSLLCNPKKLAVDLIVGVHAKEPCVVLDLLVLWTTVRTFGDWVLL